MMLTSRSTDIFFFTDPRVDFSYGVATKQYGEKLTAKAQ